MSLAFASFLFFTFAVSLLYELCMNLWHIWVQVFMVAFFYDGRGGGWICRLWPVYLFLLAHFILEMA